MANPTISFVTLPTLVNPITKAQSGPLLTNVAVLQGLSGITVSGMIDRKAIDIVCMAHEAAALGANDYRSNYANLRRDAMNFLGETLYFDLPTYLTAIHWNNSVKVDATLSADLPTLLAEARLLKALDEPALDKMHVFLRYLVAK